MRAVISIECGLFLIALSQSAHPIAQTASFTFGAAGDFSFGPQFKATAATVKQESPNFMIALGDLAYNPSEQQWCAYWKQTAKYNNVLLISGNHDSGESLAGNINNYAKFCPYTLDAPLTGTYAKQYYFDYPASAPTARFILVAAGLGGSFIGLDTTYDKGHAGYAFVQTAIDDARSKGIRWIFVGMHKNYISAMEKENEVSKDKGNTFVTMLLNKRVDVILQGHEHGYERSKQLATNPQSCAVLLPNTFNAACVVDAGNALKKGKGTVIHVLGTGGKGLREVNPSDSEYQYFAASDATTYGFGKFTVTAKAVSFGFARSDGEHFADSFSIAEQ